MKLIIMPKVAIFFCVILLSSAFTNSYGFTGDSIVSHQQTRPIFDSGIIDVTSDFFSQNSFKRYVVFGADPGSMDIVKKNSIRGVESDNGFFHVTLLEEKTASNLAAQGYHVIEDFKLDFHSDVSRIGNITGSDVANTKYNVTGNGIKIAIVDTGVDFSNPDMQDSLARDDINHPIMLDPDGQGIVLTNATFFAFIDKDKIIRNYTKQLPEDMTSSVYVSKKGVFLDVSQGGKGTTIPIYNSFFPQFGSSIIFNGTLANDMKIGNDNRNYIKSQSGVYRLGVIYQGGLDGPLARIQVVPVLFVDANVSGVYDTIIPDMSTSWEDYTRFDLKPGQKPKYDFDFTDEKPIILGSGKEFLVYDSNKDGKSDYSAGTIGAQVLDVYNAIQNKTAKVDDSLRAINGTLLPALDPDGEFFGVMADFVGHGTASAASIVSKGKQEYDIYNNTEKFTIRGVAPDAKIIPIKALWFGDTVYGWLWAAGFENNANTWNFTGNTRADIISNSWGVSNFPSFESAPGMDALSLILGVLATPHSLHDDYPGITMVSSAGNSGHGYGTIGLPNASPFGITVGATTNNVFVGYGPFKDQPRFGNTTTHHNDVIDFSSRGPGIIGDPKPDIMSIGAHGFVPSNVIKTEKDSKDESFSLFGGTSMAAPLVSGSIALLMEGMQKTSQNYDPFTIKNILMSTAKDLQNDPFTQGSGLADAYTALKFANAEHGVFAIHNDGSYKNLKKILDPAIESINSTDIGFTQFQLPSKPMPMTSWFAGQLGSGERSTTTFTIENPSDSPITVTIKPEETSLIQRNTFHGTTTTQQQDPILNKTGVYVPNYIKLSDVKQHSDVSDFFDDNTIPADSSLMVLNLNFAFSDFMNKTVDTYADDMKISSLYLYDWVDKNNDTKVLSDELSMVSRAGSWGTVQELRISNPGEKFEGVPLVGVYPVPTRYSYWIGDTQKNSTSMDYVLSASHYQKQKWQSVWPDAETVTVPAKGSAKVNMTLIVPPNSQTGVYQGFVTFESHNHVARAPVSYVVTQQVDQKDTSILISGKQSDDILFGNGYTKGAFDMANRYMAGDWRQYYFEIKDDTINSAAIEISWENDDTNMSVFVMDPKGKIVQTNMPSGVFGHFLGWPSLDWLGNSLFSQGGGFFPVKNKDETSTVIFVPINQTGTYSLLTHSTLFAGNHTTEPINIAAKFSTISVKDSVKENLESDIPIISDESEPSDMSNDTLSEPLPEIPEPSESVPEITDESADESTDFTVGIILGIIIGVAIGVTFVFIIRQKSAK